MAVFFNFQLGNTLLCFKNLVMSFEVGIPTSSVQLASSTSFESCLVLSKQHFSMGMPSR